MARRGPRKGGRINPPEFRNDPSDLRMSIDSKARMCDASKAPRMKDDLRALI